eukprot:SAG25_NODE_6906_length_520_cov_0.448931_1_plen_23_part_10
MSAKDRGIRSARSEGINSAAHLQ